MNSPGRKIEWLVWGGLILIIAVIAGLFASSRLGPAAGPLPVITQLPDFTLTNQNNEPVSLASLRGTVWVADIIFTRCPGPCAQMTRTLAKMQDELPSREQARIVSFTSDPDYDTPAILKKYAARFGANTERWSFLTGKRDEIRSLAVNDFKFVVVEKKPGDRTVPDDLFVHSTYFDLVDKQGRVRGWTDREGRLHAYFDSEDAEARTQMLVAIKQLLREPST